MPPTIDPMTEARRRADILTAIANGEPRTISGATLSRWRGLFAAGGLAGLAPKWSKCGRKPLAKLDDWEQQKAKQFYVQTESVTTALRMLAQLPECSQDTADAILKRRRSKHSIPRVLRHAVEVPAAVMEFHKSPKKVRTNFFVNPRTLTYLAPDGAERPLLVGDLSERDDMSNNFLCWVDWPWGGDKCSDRYGVRIARGQTLTQIDVASCFFQSYTFLIRTFDSYRADDIWQWVGRSYQDIFVPSIGERWERGIWKSNLLRGTAVEPGHTPDEDRIGGIAALGRRIIESQSPTTKIIENRFNYLQRVSATIPGQIGRRRGEMERENKLWTECREGRRNPREHFLSQAEVCDQIETKLQFVNTEPMEGMTYHHIPAEKYERGLRERAERNDLPQQLRPDQAYLFERNQRFATVGKGHALVRYTTPEGKRPGWWFHHPDLYRLEGEKLAVFLDELCPQAGATIVPIRPGAKPVPLRCELVDGTPQFALGLDLNCGRGATAMVDALERKKAMMNAVRSEYRALGIGNRRIARVGNVQDGTGRSATVTHGQNNFRNNLERGAADSSAMSLTKPRPAEGSIPSRSTPPLSQDADYMSRLEKQFAEANPGLAIT